MVAVACSGGGALSFGQDFQDIVWSCAFTQSVCFARASSGGGLFSGHGPSEISDNFKSYEEVMRQTGAGVPVSLSR